MKRPVVLGRAAEKEFDQAVDWYNAQRPGLGDDFISQVQLLLLDIARTPERFPLVRADARKAVMPGPFPYTIYYTLESTRIVVVSIFHQRRNPTVWQSRL